MRENGLSKENVLKLLEERVSNDCDFTEGHILGSMCTEPSNFARELYSRYLHINIGDKGISTKTAQLEIETINEIGSLFHGSNIIGNFTSGGTEGNIIAMRIARKLKPGIHAPELIVSEKAHLSFEKLADIIGIKIVKAKINSDYTLNIENLKSLINKKTCGLVGIAGTTGLGLTDPIEELGELAEKNDLFLHVDAAFGGFILPFMKELGHSIPKWDFEVQGVNSISADPHKMGTGVIPSGTFLIRDDEVLEKLAFAVPYLAGGAFPHLNLTGTRPGAVVITFWAIMNYLGRKGYQLIIKNCLETTNHLVKRISEIKGIKTVIEPPMNVVGITTEDGSDVSIINQALRKKGWKLGEFKRFNFLRIVCMPHVAKSHINAFCEDLKATLKTI